MTTYLIIDDEPIAHDIIKGYCDLLPDMKLAKDCYDAIEALGFLRTNKVDLIFLDLNMPVWDGWQFLDEFSQLDIENPPAIYIMTSSNSPYDLKKLNNYNMVTNYLVKPISRDAIATILESEVS